MMEYFFKEKVAKRFLKFILKRGLGKFLYKRDLKLDQVEFSRSGSVNLNRVRLNAGAINQKLEATGLPVRLVSGRIAQISVDLTPKAWGISKVAISGLTVTIVPVGAQEGAFPDMVGSATFESFGSILASSIISDVDMGEVIDDSFSSDEDIDDDGGDGILPDKKQKKKKDLAAEGLELLTQLIQKLVDQVSLVIADCKVYVQCVSPSLSTQATLVAELERLEYGDASPVLPGHKDKTTASPGTVSKVVRLGRCRVGIHLDSTGEGSAPGYEGSDDEVSDEEDLEERAWRDPPLPHLLYIISTRPEAAMGDDYIHLKLRQSERNITVPLIDADVVVQGVRVVISPRQLTVLNDILVAFRLPVVPPEALDQLRVSNDGSPYLGPNSISNSGGFGSSSVYYDAQDSPLEVGSLEKTLSPDDMQMIRDILMQRQTQLNNNSNSNSNSNSNNTSNNTYRPLTSLEPFKPQKIDTLTFDSKRGKRQDDDDEDDDSGDSGDEQFFDFDDGRPDSPSTIAIPQHTSSLSSSSSSSPSSISSFSPRAGSAPVPIASRSGPSSSTGVGSFRGGSLSSPGTSFGSRHSSSSYLGVSPLVYTSIPLTTDTGLGGNQTRASDDTYKPATHHHVEIKANLTLVHTTLTLLYDSFTDNTHDASSPLSLLACDHATVSLDSFAVVLQQTASLKTNIDLSIGGLSVSERLILRPENGPPRHVTSMVVAFQPAEDMNSAPTTRVQHMQHKAPEAEPALRCQVALVPKGILGRREGAGTDTSIALHLTDVRVEWDPLRPTRLENLLNAMSAYGAARAPSTSHDAPPLDAVPAPRPASGFASFAGPDSSSLLDDLDAVSEDLDADLSQDTSEIFSTKTEINLHCTLLKVVVRFSASGSRRVPRLHGAMREETLQVDVMGIHASTLLFSDQPEATKWMLEFDAVYGYLARPGGSGLRGSSDSTGTALAQIFEAQIRSTEGQHVTPVEITIRSSASSVAHAVPAEPPSPPRNIDDTDYTPPPRRPSSHDGGPFSSFMSTFMGADQWPSAAGGEEAGQFIHSASESARYFVHVILPVTRIDIHKKDYDILMDLFSSQGSAQARTSPKPGIPHHHGQVGASVGEGEGTSLFAVGVWVTQGVWVFKETSDPVTPGHAYELAFANLHAFMVTGFKGRDASHTSITVGDFTLFDRPLGASPTSRTPRELGLGFPFGSSAPATTALTPTSIPILYTTRIAPDRRPAHPLCVTIASDKSPGTKLGPRPMGNVTALEFRGLTLVHFVGCTWLTRVLDFFLTPETPVASSSSSSSSPSPSSSSESSPSTLYVTLSDISIAYTPPHPIISSALVHIEEVRLRFPEFSPVLRLTVLGRGISVSALDDVAHLGHVIGHEDWCLHTQYLPHWQAMGFVPLAKLDSFEVAITSGAPIPHPHVPSAVVPGGFLLEAKNNKLGVKVCADSLHVLVGLFSNYMGLDIPLSNVADLIIAQTEEDEHVQGSLLDAMEDAPYLAATSAATGHASLTQSIPSIAVFEGAASSTNAPPHVMFQTDSATIMSSVALDDVPIVRTPSPTMVPLATRSAPAATTTSSMTRKPSYSFIDEGGEFEPMVAPVASHFHGSREDTAGKGKAKAKENERERERPPQPPATAPSSLPHTPQLGKLNIMTFDDYDPDAIQKVTHDFSAPPTPSIVSHFPSTSLTHTPTVPSPSMHALSSSLPSSASSSSLLSASSSLSSSALLTSLLPTEARPEAAAHWFNPGEPYMVVDDYISEVQAEDEHHFEFSLPSEYPPSISRIIVRDVNVEVVVCPGMDFTALVEQEEGPPLQQRGSSRQEGTFLALVLSKIQVQLDKFPMGSLQASRMVVGVGEVEVRDGVPSSLWNMFLCYDATVPRLRGSPMVRMELASVRPDPVAQPLLEELRLKLSLLPIKLNVDQDAVDLLVAFLSYKPASTTSVAGEVRAAPTTNKITSVDAQKAAQELQFFQTATLDKIQVKIDYKPKRLSQLYNRFKSSTGEAGGIIELVKGVPLEGAAFHLPRVKITGAAGVGGLAQNAMVRWRPHIWNTLAVGYIRGVKGVRPIVDVSSGVADFIMFPIEQYRRDGRILAGLKKGSSALGRVVAKEVLTAGANLAVGAQGLLETADTFLKERVGPGNADIASGEHSKFSDAPRDTREGIQHAYESVSREFRTVAYRVVSVPMEAYNTEGASGAIREVIKGVPAAILRPLIGVSEGVAKTLLGVRHGIDPAQKEELDRKYNKKQDAPS